jgi:hypothetical protein
LRLGAFIGEAIPPTCAWGRFHEPGRVGRYVW